MKVLKSKWKTGRLQKKLKKYQKDGCCCDTKPEEWLQQTPGSTSDISVQESAVRGTAKVLSKTLGLPGLR